MIPGAKGLQQLWKGIEGVWKEGRQMQEPIFISVCTLAYKAKNRLTALIPRLLILLSFFFCSRIHQHDESKWFRSCDIPRRWSGWHELVFNTMNSFTESSITLFETVVYNWVADFVEFYWLLMWPMCQIHGEITKQCSCSSDVWPISHQLGTWIICCDRCKKYEQGFQLWWQLFSEICST